MKRRTRKAFSMIEMMISVMIAAILLGLITTVLVTLNRRFSEATDTMLQANASLRYLSQLQIHARGCEEANIVPFGEYSEEDFVRGNVYFKKNGKTTCVSAKDYKIGADVFVQINNATRILVVTIGEDNYEIPY